MMPQVGTPFSSLPPTPSASRANSVHHGGAEQEHRRDRFRRLFEEMPKSKEPRTSIPRTPRRDRSPAADGDRRSRDRDPMTASESDPMPVLQHFGFRLLAVERTLREHAQAISTQKSLVEKLDVHAANAKEEKEALEKKLDSAFAGWNTRLVDIEKNSEVLKAEMHSLIQALSTRVE